MSYGGSPMQGNMKFWISFWALFALSIVTIIVSITIAVDRENARNHETGNRCIAVGGQWVDMKCLRGSPGR